MDISGRPVYQIKKPVLGDSYQTIWDGTATSNGIYFYSVHIAGKSFTGKLVKM